MLVPRLHPQSIMARSPQNEGLYSNLYDKDMSLMRKLMNLDEFQCSSNGNGSNITAPNSDINASKQFHPYTNGSNGGGGSAVGGIFNGKFTSPTNFASSFPYDNKQQQQHIANGMGRNHHDGLLKPCYDHFTNTTTTTNTKSEPLDDNFGSNPITASSNGSGIVGYKKQSSTITTTAASLFSSGGNVGSGGGFMNQFSHESLFGANNHHHHQHSHHQHHHNQPFTKLNEINNNSNSNNNNSGIVIKLENGGNIGVGQHANDFTKMSNEQQQNLCSRSSTSIATASNKTEPNEFRNNNNNNSNSSNHIKDSNNHIDNDDERKNSTLHNDDSNDGFTQL